MIREKVGIVILVNDFIVPQWIFKCIENLVKSEYASVKLIISNDLNVGDDNNTGKDTGSLPARIYEAFDRLIFRRSHDFYGRRDITELITRASIIDLTCNPDSDFGTIYGKKEVLNRLKPDVVLLFGRHRLDTDMLELSRYGFLRFSIDNNNFPGKLQHGYREVVSHLPLSDTAIEIISAKNSSPDILYFSRESTYHFSVNINRNKVFWRATHLLPRIIEGLSKYGDDYLSKLRKKNQFSSIIDNSPYGGSFAEVFNDLIKHLLKLSLLGINKMIHTDAFSWQLMTKLGNDESGNLYDFASFTLLKRPRRKFWADPFVIATQHRYYLFVEEFIYRQNRAHISVLEFNLDGKYLKSGRIIENPYHMSYPFTFKVGQTYYMIPETSQNRTIELYRCTEFPYKWEFDRYIMKDLSATDTTPFFHDDKWWLFTTVDSTNGLSGCSTELFLFYSDDLFSGEWTSHPLNPIVSDESNARCAGKLFLRDGKIFRPSQDCSLRYGRGININLITKLNTHDYNEIRVQEIKPDWNMKLKGTHTLNSEGGMTVIDVYSYHNRLSFN